MQMYDKKVNRVYFGEKVTLSCGKKGIRDITSSKLIKTNDELMKAPSLLNASMNQINQYPNWFVIDGEYYYYKDMGLFNELFMSEMAKEFELQSLDYSLVLNEGKLGIVSKNFKKSSSKYYSFNELFMSKKLFIPKNIEEYESQIQNNFNPSSKLIDDAYKLMAFDFLNGMRDRRSYNVCYESSGGRYRFAPIFDNAGSFGYVKLEELDTCFDHLLFPVDNIVDSRELHTLQLFRNNIALSSCFAKCLDIDINEVLKRTRRKHQLRISYDEREYIRKYYDTKKSIIEHTLKLKDMY